MTKETMYDISIWKTAFEWVVLDASVPNSYIEENMIKYTRVLDAVNALNEDESWVLNVSKEADETEE